MTSTIKRELREWTILLLAVFCIRTFLLGMYQVPTGSMETTMLVGERFVADKLTPFFSPPKHGEIIAFCDPGYPYSDNPIMNWFERYVWGPSNWTKRVIGIPGDHLQGMIENDEQGKPHPVVYRNGEKLDEFYINKYPLVPYNGPLVHWLSWDPNISFEDQPFYIMDGDLVRKWELYVQRLGHTPVRWPGTPLDAIGSSGTDLFDVELGENEYWAMGDNRLGSDDSRRWGKLDGRLIHGRILWRLFSIDSNESWLILDIIKNPLSFWHKVRWSRCLNMVR